MKKAVRIIFMLFAVAAIMAPAVTVAQATARNQTRKDLVIWSTDRKNMVVVASNDRATVKFAPESGSFSFDLYVKNNGREEKVGTVTKSVTKGNFSLVNSDIYGQTEKPVKVSTTLPEEKVVTSTKGKPLSLKINNKSDFKFYFINGPAQSLALDPGKISENTYEFYTGRYKMTVERKNSKESGENKFSGTEEGASEESGPSEEPKTFSQAVISTIITEGQTELIITNEDFVSVSSGVNNIKTFLKSEIPFKIVVVGGKWAGKALNTNEITGKQTIDLGFNSITIWYFEETPTSKVKVEADIEIIVTRRDRPLILRQSDIKNKRIVVN